MHGRSKSGLHRPGSGWGGERGVMMTAIGLVRLARARMIASKGGVFPADKRGYDLMEEGISI